MALICIDEWPLSRIAQAALEEAQEERSTFEGIWSSVSRGLLPAERTYKMLITIPLSKTI